MPYGMVEVGNDRSEKKLYLKWEGDFGRARPDKPRATGVGPAAGPRACSGGGVCKAYARILPPKPLR